MNEYINLNSSLYNTNVSCITEQGCKCDLSRDRCTKERKKEWDDRLRFVNRVILERRTKENLIVGMRVRMLTMMSDGKEFRIYR